MTAVLGFHASRLVRISGTNAAVTHPGTILVVFFYLYSIIPVLFFMTETVEGAPFAWYAYSDEELRAHLLRGAVFLIFLTLSLHCFVKANAQHVIHTPFAVSNTLLIFCIAMFAVPNFIMSQLSAPINSYYDFYTRFDHLTGVWAVFVVISKRILWGITPILILLLSIYYIKSTRKYVLSVSLVIAVILVNSYGARIDAMLALNQAVCFRALWARKQLKWQHALGLLPLAALALYFLRYLELARVSAGSVVDVSAGSALLMAPGEFFALLFPSIDLYRMSTTQMPQGLLVYAKDVLSILPFLDIGELDLMHWYWKTFVPTAPVAPYTMGVLADPAVLGEWWVIVEAVVIGRIALVVNRLRTSNDPLRLAAYGYLTSVGLLVLKYNLLSYVDLLINNFLPAAFVMWIAISVQKSSNKRQFVTQV
jgi:hypothetical protein